MDPIALSAKTALEIRLDLLQNKLDQVQKDISPLTIVINAMNEQLKVNGIESSITKSQVAFAASEYTFNDHLQILEGNFPAGFDL